MKLFLRILGILFYVLPPALSTLAFFPIWLSSAETALSALAMIPLCLGAVALFRLFRKHPSLFSGWMLWLGLWAFLFVFCPILPAIETVALISFPTALLGSLFFRLSDRAAQKG